MLKIVKIFVLFCLGFVPCFASTAVKEMSLEEKVGQVLMVHFHGEVANEEARVLVQDLKVGGIIYYNWANGLQSPQQVHTLSSGLQQLTKNNPHAVPLLITTDQEGGVVTRLESGFTIFPGNRALAVSGEPDLARKAACAMGEELQAVGINMNLAPVVDITDLRSPKQGARAFSDDPDEVIKYGEKALKGYHEAGIIATLKHFPGYSRVKVDPHEALPVVDLPLALLKNGPLRPFERLASQADVIMTAHILVPALDPDNCATLSPLTMSYLRNQLGFQGVILSDSLVMEGVLKKYSTVEEVAIETLKAGCDMLLLGGKLLSGEREGFELTLSDVQRIHGALVESVKSGRIPLARLDDAVERILKLKSRSVLLSGEELSTHVDTEAHKALAAQITSLYESHCCNISTQVASRIGEKIWKNECEGSLEGLTHWKKGENFASLGIGHFIWYPVDKQERFQETFPTLVAFLKQEGATLPTWLEEVQGCPWNTREEFYQQAHSREMRSLRKFLFDTKSLQAKFMGLRLESAFRQMLEGCTPKEKEHITTLFLSLSEEAKGLYALIDYVNFKGVGVASAETYNGQGWGLLQVLRRIPLTTQKPLEDFVEAAKELLSQRVHNSPPERGEAKWLKGWHCRIDTYLR